MAGVVQFDYAKWAVRYGTLARNVTEELAAVFFEEAQLYCDNSPCSPVQDLGQRSQLLNMLVSHLIVLNVPMNGEQPSPLVGRISQAAEGSVSVQVENNYPPGTVQWFQQTKYGAQFWAATGQFRSFVYVPGATYFPDPYAPFFDGV